MRTEPSDELISYVETCFREESVFPQIQFAALKPTIEREKNVEGYRDAFIETLPTRQWYLPRNGKKWLLIQYTEFLEGEHKIQMLVADVYTVAEVLWRQREGVKPVVVNFDDFLFNFVPRPVYHLCGCKMVNYETRLVSNVVTPSSASDGIFYAMGRNTFELWREARGLPKKNGLHLHHFITLTAIMKFIHLRIPVYQWGWENDLPVLNGETRALFDRIHDALYEMEIDDSYQWYQERIPLHHRMIDYVPSTTHYRLHITHQKPVYDDVKSLDELFPS